MNRTSFFVIFITVIICCAILAAPADAARKIIFSTDIGDDIDDAFALAMLLNSPELEIDSVIVSYGPTSKRGKLTAKLLDIAGRRDFPLIIGRYVWNKNRDNSGQLSWAFPYFHSKPIVNDGAKALARRIMAAEGKITLVPVGPFTDIADVFRIAPEVKDKIDEIILMGGSAFRDYRMRESPCVEYNIKVDIKSAQEVFKSGVPIVMVGLDVTAMMQPSPEDMNRIAESKDPVVQALHQLYKAWGHSVPTMYDGVAVAVAFQRDLVKMEHLCVEVDDKGYTNIVKDGKPNTLVCTEIDKDRFMKLFMDRILPN